MASIQHCFSISNGEALDRNTEGWVQRNPLT